MTVFLIIVGAVLFAIVASVLMNNEEEIVEKAQSNNKAEALFFHLVAKLTVSGYDGYNPFESEKEAIEEYLNQPSEYDTHPVGSYLKLRKENKDMLKSYGSMGDKPVQVAESGSILAGLAVLAVFVLVVVLGTMYV